MGDAEKDLTDADVLRRFCVSFRTTAQWPCHWKLRQPRAGRNQAGGFTRIKGWSCRAQWGPGDFSRRPASAGLDVKDWTPTTAPEGSGSPHHIHAPSMALFLTDALSAAAGLGRYGHRCGIDPRPPWGWMIAGTHLARQSFPKFSRSDFQQPITRIDTRHQHPHDVLLDPDDG